MSGCRAAAVPRVLARAESAAATTTAATAGTAPQKAMPARAP
jgi:hypothetical protein